MRAARLTDPWLSRETNAAPAAISRILIGLAALIKCVYLLQIGPQVLAENSLRAPWFAEAPIISLATIQSVLTVWMIAAVALTLGVGARVGGVVLCCCVVIVVLADRHFYQNHLYLLGILTALVSMSRADQRFAVVRSQRHSDVTPTWPLELIKVQITIVYFFGAITKLNNDYLSGSTVASAWNGSAVGAWLVALVGQNGMIAISAVTIAIELWIAAALWTRRRRVAVAAGVLLHSAIIMLMPLPYDLTVFALLMFAGYALFLEGSIAGISSPLKQSSAT